jgi:hypothetical protein
MHCPWFLNVSPKLRQPPFVHWFLLVGTRGSGLTATPSGNSPAGTVAGLLGDSPPPGPTSYWETLSLKLLVT